jgi:hypothetical protein
MKSLALALSWVVFFQFAAPPVRAQQQPTELNIIVVEGEGAINNARQRVTREPVVRIEDENHKPIAGAAVVFTLPTEGTTGAFGNGSHTLAIMTDRDGLAKGKGLRVNQVTGKLPIHVTASYRGLTARTTVNELNEGVPGAKASTGGGHGALIAVIVILGAAAAGGGAYLATHKSGTSTTTAPPPTGPTPIGITPGTGTIVGGH